MPKGQRIDIDIDEPEECGPSPFHGGASIGAPALTARELRGLYLLREKHVEDIVAAAVNLDEGQRRLAVRLLEAMNEHKRSLLS